MTTSTTEMTPEQPAQPFRLSLRWDDLERRRNERECPRNFPEAAWRALREDTFHAVGTIPALPKETRRRVGLGMDPCPLCGWRLGKTDWRECLVLYRGEKTGYEYNHKHRCPCYQAEAQWQRWAGPKSMVPVHYRFTRMVDLKPNVFSTLSQKDQQMVIDQIRSRPHWSYVFCGKAGAGKTTYLVALYGEALNAWSWWEYQRGGGPEGVWYMNANTLLTQHMDFNRRSDFPDAEVPRVTVAKIMAARNAGFRPRLFLDELDKISMTAPRLTALFEILNAMYEADGQIAVSSNMAHKDLVAMLGPFAEAMERRIIDSMEKDETGAWASGGRSIHMHGSSLQIETSTFRSPDMARGSFRSAPEIEEAPTL